MKNALRITNRNLIPWLCAFCLLILFRCSHFFIVFCVENWPKRRAVHCMPLFRYNFMVRLYWDKLVVGLCRITPFNLECNSKCKEFSQNKKHSRHNKICQPELKPFTIQNPHTHLAGKISRTFFKSLIANAEKKKKRVVVDWQNHRIAPNDVPAKLSTHTQLLYKFVTLKIVYAYQLACICGENFAFEHTKPQPMCI